MTLSSDSLPAGVKDALQRGNTIEAIKLLRSSKGLGLKEAKDAIDAYLQGKPNLLQSQTGHAHLPANVLSALQQGNKIEAIRLLREQTGLGLKEAKDAVEFSARSDPFTQGSVSPGKVTGENRLVWWIVGAVIACMAGYWLLRGAG